MNCPNCQIPFIAERGDKFHCETCGWFENVGDPNPEWHTCEAPESTPAPEPNPAALEPDPAVLEPDPAALEPDPAVLEPDPGLGEVSEVKLEVKSYLGGILTVTEIDE